MIKYTMFSRQQAAHPMLLTQFSCVLRRIKISQKRPQTQLALSLALLCACHPIAPLSKEQGESLLANNVCQNEQQQQMLSLINQARAESRWCGEDYFAPALPVSWACQLAQAAQVHSLDMQQQAFFSHTGSDGSNVALRVEAQGYQWQELGENIAAGQSSVEEVMLGWLNSPGHCVTIMNASLQQVGTALVYEHNASYQYYWTQVFARPFFN